MAAIIRKKETNRQANKRTNQILCVPEQRSQSCLKKEVAKQRRYQQARHCITQLILHNLGIKTIIITLRTEGGRGTLGCTTSRAWPLQLSSGRFSQCSCIQPHHLSSSFPPVNVLFGSSWSGVRTPAIPLHKGPHSDSFPNLSHSSLVSTL